MNKNQIERFDNTNKKIAFCFLIFDSINQEELWHQFFQNVDTSKYTIYIHYKENKPLKYFEPYKLKNCIETSWANISLVKAQNLLLEEGLKDEENSHFIFLSNSCIPIKPFSHIYNNLDTDYSYFSVCPMEASFPRCDYALQFLEKKYIKKSSQWCILNRKHADILTKNTEYFNWFDQPGMIPDEQCYITYLYYKHLQNEIISTDSVDKGATAKVYATTFVNWINHGINVKTYEYISQDELDELINSKSFFARKFEINCNLDYLTSNLLNG
jgi:hypothetical protein